MLMAITSRAARRERGYKETILLRRDLSEILRPRPENFESPFKSP